MPSWPSDSGRQIDGERAPRLELVQDEIRFQSARVAYYYVAYMSTVPDETLQVQRFSQYV